MKKGFSTVFACVGAVVGAGFASGREVIVFFTRYGAHAWWLILVAAAVMAWVCGLCMQEKGEGSDWTELFGANRRWAVLVSGILMVLTAGAMVAAAGHMVALVWANEWAYAIGAVCTLLLAWLVSYRSLRAMGWISAILSILLVCVLLHALMQPPRSAVVLRNDLSFSGVICAAVFAAAYASMNMMLAIGVVRRCAGQSRWTAVGTGAVIAVLLGMSNALYSRYPELLDAAFPLVALLNRYGRNGFLISVVLLYLSVFTTLTAVIYALRAAVERHCSNPYLSPSLVMGLPLMVSCAGFSGIVDKMYAPAGLICLLTVFLPLQAERRNHRQNKVGLDF